MKPDPATAKLPPREQELRDLNAWIEWLEDWIESSSKGSSSYRSVGPLETTQGIRNLTNFLRGIAYSYPTR